MFFKSKRSLGLVVASALAVTFAMPASAEIEPPADIKKILKNGDCFKCHTVDKEKKGPTYLKIAAKFKSKSPAEADKLFNDNLTKKPKVKLDDGSEEEHKGLDPKNQNPDDMKKLFQWIMSL